MFTCQCFTAVTLETCEGWKVKGSLNVCVDSLKKKVSKSLFSFCPQITLVMEFSQKPWVENRTINLSDWQNIFHLGFNRKIGKAT